MRTSTDTPEATSSSCNFYFINNENRNKIPYEKRSLQGKRSAILPNIHGLNQKSAKKRNIDYFKSSSHFNSPSNRYLINFFYYC